MNDLVIRGAFYTSIARPEPLYISGATEIEEEDGEADEEEVQVDAPGAPSGARGDLGSHRHS